MDHLCYFYLCVLCFRACLIIVALGSPAGKGLTAWLSFVLSNCECVTFPLSIPDLCTLSYFGIYLKIEITVKPV